ncbi:MAG: prolipoprotein diacylglyceryl transferase [Thermoleophilia bacterium]|nr:prolipoprotein diacylglyceryl transferase [Thermoleophilia bacterium]
MAPLIASIPSPSRGALELGPISIHAYGLMLLLAIAAAIALTGIRWTRRGGDWDLVFRVAVWGVAAGIVGARAYHVVTSWEEVPDVWWGPLAVWKGGLGVWGGILFGTIAGLIVVRQAGVSMRRFMDATAPGLLLAQAVGRWGNWWNQELYGRPTDAAWGLEIDPEHRLPGYLLDTTFHPTFLYESLYALLGVGFLLLVDRLFRIRPPALFALYVAYYTAGRVFIEELRIDPAHEFAGLRLNTWVAGVLFVLAAGFFVYWQFIRPRSHPEPEELERPRPQEGRAMAIPKGRVRGSR